MLSLVSPASSVRRRCSHVPSACSSPASSWSSSRISPGHSVDARSYASCPLRPFWTTIVCLSSGLYLYGAFRFHDWVFLVHVTAPTSLELSHLFSDDVQPSARLDPSSNGCTFLNETPFPLAASESYPLSAQVSLHIHALRLCRGIFYCSLGRWLHDVLSSGCSRGTAEISKDMSGNLRSHKIGFK